MTGSGDRVWDEAIQIGIRNREWIEYAGRHCVSMEFVPSGGRGLAEEVSGLPINSRQAKCPVALGGMASNLPRLMSGFFRENRVGCSHRPRMLSGTHASLPGSVAPRTNARAALMPPWAATECARRAASWKVNETTR